MKHLLIDTFLGIVALFTCFLVFLATGGGVQSSLGAVAVAFNMVFLLWGVYAVIALQTA